MPLRLIPERPDYDGADPRVLRCVIAYNRHGGYCIPRASMHRPCAQAILAGGEFEPETIAALERYARLGDVIHAGTYFGDMLPATSRAGRAGGLVWAFEPNHESFRCASTTIAINGLMNVRLAHGALGDSEGFAMLRVCDDAGTPLGGRSHLDDTLPMTGSPPGYGVPVLRIDAAVPADRRVALIQLDVERQERAALGGAMATIERCLPALILETLPDEAWITSRLAPLGYRQAGKVGPNTLLVADAAAAVS
jgi:FkbM family methyltransferase